MDNPGPFQLTYQGGPFPIVGPGTFFGDWTTDLDGMLGVSLQAQLLYGNGGTTVTVYFQTSLDQGQTAIDICAVQFATVSATEIANLSGLTPKTTPAAPVQQALTPGTSVDGVVGDRLRAVVVVAGTYGLSTLLNLTGVAR